MHQAEAMWISFGGSDYPFAVKIATGKICAVTGDDWVNHLNGDPQDYLVLPEQPWLDGYCVERGFIRQFVAMPLGEGYTAEEQLTGEAEHGGLQVVAYPMKRKRYERLMSPRFAMDFDAGPDVCSSPAPDMGLAPGGRMRQEIYDDPYGLDAWDQRHASRCFVSIANSTQWMAVTGERPPTLPPSAKEYSEAGLPWFEWYGGDAKAVAGAKKLASLASVAELGKVKGEDPLPENESTRVTGVRTIRRTGDTRVRSPVGHVTAGRAAAWPVSHQTEPHPRTGVARADGRVAVLRSTPSAQEAVAAAPPPPTSRRSRPGSPQCRIAMSAT